MKNLYANVVTCALVALAILLFGVVLAAPPIVAWQAWAQRKVSPMFELYGLVVTDKPRYLAESTAAVVLYYVVALGWFVVFDMGVQLFLKKGLTGHAWLVILLGVTTLTAHATMVWRGVRTLRKRRKRTNALNVEN